MNRMVIIRAGGLGDTVLTLPAIRALREHYPAASIEVTGYPERWEIATGLVDAIHAVDTSPWSALYATRTSAELRRQLADVDLIVAWTVQRPALDGLPLLHASPYPPPGCHAADHLVRSLEPIIGPISERAVPRIEVDGGPRQGIVLHPGAGATWKRWPAERYAALGRALVDRGLDVSLLEGPADAAAVAAVLERMTLPVVRPEAVAGLMRTLAGAGLVVGNDSGVTHLAAAVGTPVIALFGPTDPAAWGPRGNVRILRHCAKRVTGPGIRVCDDPGCMEAVSVAEVTRQILQSDNPAR